MLETLIFPDFFQAKIHVTSVRLATTAFRTPQIPLVLHALWATTAHQVQPMPLSTHARLVPTIHT